MKLLIKKIRMMMHHAHVSEASIISLILTNIVVIIFAIVFHWKLEAVILLYWGQNIIIGIFGVYKLIITKNIIFAKSKKIILSKKDQITLEKKYWATFEKKITKRVVISNFGLAFFLFNWVYIFFFRDFIDIGATLYIILIPLGLFLLNHIISFFVNYKKDSRTPIKYDQFMSLVFIRIIPIHFFIIFWAPLALWSSLILYAINGIVWYSLVSQDIVGTICLIFFMLIKTFFEIITHIITHVDNDSLEEIDKMKK